MWGSQSFLLVLFFIIVTDAHPKKNLHEKPNEPGLNETALEAELLQAEESQTSASRKYPLMQNVHKPRILVTYGNVYKSNQSYANPIDPFQNILLYFLMNLGRELNQSPVEETYVEQPKERRSPDFFGDVKHGFTDVSGKVVNGTKNVGKKIQSTYKHITSREVPEIDNEETHFFPHMGESCLCFNHMARRAIPDVTTKGEAGFELVSEIKFDDSNDSITENNVDETNLMAAKADNRLQNLNTEVTKHFKTTELKTENHNIPALGEKEKSTVSVDGDQTNGNNTFMRVLRVIDFNDSLVQERTTKLTTPENTHDKQEQIVITGEEIVLDLQYTPKNKTKEEKSVSPPQTNENENTNKKKNEKVNSYFLSYSGGTDKRTTAFNGHLNGEINSSNGQTDIFNRQIKTSRRRRKRRRPEKYPIQNILGLNVDVVKRMNKNQEKSEFKIIREKILTSLRNDSLYDNVPILSENFSFPHKNKLCPEKQKEHLHHGFVFEKEFFTRMKALDATKYKILSSEDRYKSQQSLLLTVTIPTFLGAGIGLLILCYILRTKGWCCQLFTDKSKLVIVEVRSAKRDGKKEEQNKD